MVAASSSHKVEQRTYTSTHSREAHKWGALEDLQLHPLISGPITAAHHRNGLGLGRAQAQLSGVHSIACCAH
eukprot:scaffold70419_cov23-Tisochrysis_lutea.AAC.1